VAEAEEQGSISSLTWGSPRNWRRRGPRHTSESVLPPPTFREHQKGSGAARNFRQQMGVPTLLMAQRSAGRMRLQQEGPPHQARASDIDAWPAKFARIANGVHRCRGVEVTLTRILQLSKRIHLSCIVTTLGPLDFSKRWCPATRFDGPLRDLVTKVMC
jgi:hypothetical protein